MRNVILFAAMLGFLATASACTRNDDIDECLNQLPPSTIIVNPNDVVE